MTAPESTTSSRKMTAAERKKQAVARRIGGWSFQAIGDELGVSKQAAHQLVKKALEEINEKTAEDADILRRLELERLDTMRNAIWGKVLMGDVFAVDRAIRISKRMSELTGIDAPVKQDITSGGESLAPKYTDEERLAKMKALAAAIAEEMKNQDA